MAITLPFPVRVAVGILATGIDLVRSLPDELPSIPVIVAGNAMRLSMKVQQEIASLATRGDELLGGVIGAPQESPAWATFDDDEPVKPAPRPAPRYTKPVTTANVSAPAAGSERRDADDAIATDPAGTNATGLKTPTATALPPESTIAMDAAMDVSPAIVEQALAGSDAGPSEDAALAEAVLEEAVLEEAVLEEAVLEEAVLEEAVLEEAVLEEAAEMVALEEALVEEAAEVTALEDAVVDEAVEVAALEEALVEEAAEVAALEDAVLEEAVEMAALEEALVDEAAEVTALEDAAVEEAVLAEALDEDLGGDPAAADDVTEVLLVGGALIDQERANGANGSDPSAEEPNGDEPTDDGPPALPGYDRMTLAQVRGHLRELTADDISALLQYERDGEERAPFLTLLSNRLVTLDAQQS